MDIVKISKILDIASYISILLLIVIYIFFRPSVEILLIALLGVCVIKMIGSMLKGNFYEEKYRKLKEDNEFMQRRVDELTKMNNNNN